jgi:hypothetical protein
MKTYISGKISGTNIDATKCIFDEVEQRLKLRGVSAVNPFNLPHKKGSAWIDYIITDIRALNGCTSIIMIKGWRTSKGAWIEWIISKLNHKRVYYSLNEIEINCCKN